MSDEFETQNQFGYLFEDKRTEEQNLIHESIVGAMPKFEIVGNEVDSNVKKVCLWDCTKKANNGQHFQTFRQVSGSCVGCSGGQVVWYLSAIEVIRLNDPEQALLPFWLLPYGRSRFYGGLGGRGEGSFNSAYAKAIAQDGIFPNEVDGVPKPTSSNGLVWGRNAELEWSDGRAISDTWLTRSRKHLVKSVAQVRTADAVAQALRNWYPVHIASMWGGMMQPPTEGTPAVRLNRRVTQWAHAMCVLAWWEHPTLGEIFYILNSWGLNAHGNPTGDEPPGGFWVRKEDMDWIARTGECYAFSQFEGFPSQDLKSWFI